jgi:multiple sugar transport system permease protein
MKRKVKIFPALKWLIVLPECFIALFPIYILLLTSFKSRRDVFSGILSLKASFSLENYLEILNTYNFLFFLKNSLIVATVATAVTIVLGSFAAYGFSKYEFKGKTAILLSVIALRMIPPVSLLIPIYLISSQHGLNDTKTVLILINTSLNLPFIIWLLKGFFDGISNELIDSAQIDGCSHFRTYAEIILPLIKPGLFATAVFTFIMTWNDFMFPLVLTSVKSPTLPIMASKFQTEFGVDWGGLGSAGVLVLFPVVTISLLTQRWLVSGLTQGSVKG